MTRVNCGKKEHMKSQVMEFFPPQSEDGLMVRDRESTDFLKNDEPSVPPKPVSFHGPELTMQPYPHSGINE